MRHHTHLLRHIIDWAVVIKEWIESTLFSTFNVERVNFDIDYEITGSEPQGSMYWNEDEETIDIVNNGAITQVGQELHTHVRNDSGAQLEQGDVVMAVGTVGASGRIKVDLFDPALTGEGTHAEMALVGVVTETIPDGEDGKVTTYGKVRGIDTSSWSEGDVLWVDPTTPGVLTNVSPDHDELGMLLAFVISSKSNGTISVRTFPMDFHRFPHLVIGQIGDGDYTEFEDDGTLVMHGDSTVWDDFSVPLTRDKQGQNAKPDYDFTNLGLLFPQNDDGEIVYLTLQMSHAKKMGSDIKFHLHYIQDGATEPTFKIDYKFYNNGDTVPSTWTTLSTADTGGDKGIIPYTSGDMLQIGTFPTIAAPANETVSANLDLKFYRDDNDVSGDVLAKYIDFHFERDTLGSSEEYTK